MTIQINLTRFTRAEMCTPSLVSTYRAPAKVCWETKATSCRKNGGRHNNRMHVRSLRRKVPLFARAPPTNGKRTRSENRASREPQLTEFSACRLPKLVETGLRARERWGHADYRWWGDFHDQNKCLWFRYGTGARGENGGGGTCFVEPWLAWCCYSVKIIVLFEWYVITGYPTFGNIIFLARKVGMFSFVSYLWNW